MNQEIRYKGLSYTPDELASPNGELALSVNAELHNGALRPSVLQGTATTHPLTAVDGSILQLVFVHVTPAYTHFIASSIEDDENRTVSWHHQDGALGGTIEHSFTNIVSVESVGNTLVILDQNGIHYSLWKDNAYKYLGQQPPFVQLSFSLSEDHTGTYQVQSTNSDESDADTSVIHDKEVYEAIRKTGLENKDLSFSDDTKTKVVIEEKKRSTVTEAVWAIINHTNSVITEDNHFYAPFFVRYAYRLYDKSTVHTMHSAPVFMPVDERFRAFLVDCLYNMNGKAEISYASGGTAIKRRTTDGSTNILEYAPEYSTMYVPSNVSLQYQCLNPQTFEQLRSDWKDIVKSIDIFVSPPITREKPAELIKEIIPLSPDKYGLRNGKMVNLLAGGAKTSRKSLPTRNYYFANCVFDIPRISDDEYLDKIKSTAEFYLIHSFDVKDSTFTPSDTPVDVPLKEKTLLNLTLKHRLQDDYKTHNLLLPGSQAGTYVYNNRLHLFSLRERLFQGFSPQLLLPVAQGVQFTKYDFPNNTSSVQSYSSNIDIKKVYVELDTEDGRKIVSYTPSATEAHCMSAALSYSILTYPDTRAKRMILDVQLTNSYSANSYDDSLYHITLQMTPSTVLNASLVTDLFGKSPVKIRRMQQFNTRLEWADFLDRTEGAYNPDIDQQADVVSMYNKIYTSQADNPYYFPLRGINSVGSGTIIGIAANTRALSPGQFGQFPLLAFASDGIWALSTSTEGLYSDIHSIRREVCSNPKSICQLDQQVTYATAKGLSVITEQDSTYISLMLQGSLRRALPQDIVDKMEEIFNTPRLIQQLSISDQPSPVATFQVAKVIYDFSSDRLLIVTDSDNKDMQTLLVYSLSDHTWSTKIVPSILSAVNSYPAPYLQDKATGKVVCLNIPYPYDNTSAEETPTLILTRALTFGDAMYNITGFLHDKMANGKTTMLLFGSNNLIDWHYIGKTNSEKEYYMPSTAYRFFRLALHGNLKPSEMYISTKLNVAEKFPKL